MITHSESQLVNFEDCGFSRSPEWPLPGEAVTICCRTDADAVCLNVWDAQGAHIYPGQSTSPQHFRFDLPPFQALQRVSYQFVAGQETSPLYSFDVVGHERYEKPLYIQTIEEGQVAVGITETECLYIHSAGHLALTVRRTAPECHGATAQAAVSCGESVRAVCSQAHFLQVLRGECVLLSLDAIDLWRNAEGDVVKIGQRYGVSHPRILGTGERFDAVQQQGLSTHGSVTEKFTHQGAQTYLPVPFFMTEQHWGWYAQSDIPVDMRFGAETLSTLRETEGNTLSRDVMLFGQPRALLDQYMRLTGACALPPEWAFGVWISGNGWNSDDEVQAQLACLKAYDYPASVMVLEQWSDERTFYLWNRDRFPQPEQTIADIRKAGLHAVLWQIPVIKHEWDGLAGAALEQDTRNAIEKGYLVKAADGSPYRITDRWFRHSLLPDFTNPDAVSWWFSKRKYLLEMGVEGFKTDGGEFLFDKKSRLHSGLSGKRAHNLYPMLYLHAYQAFLRENNVEGITFSRAGYAGAQTVPIHWAGDQVSEWSELRAQLTAGLSAGLSGVVFWGFDIGGFAGPIPDRELYLRATAMGCFCPIMQWHSEPRGGQFAGGLGENYNNDRSPWNLAEKWNDPEILETACAFARLRQALQPYLWQEAQYCAAHNRPMMAHLCLDYPEDATAWQTDDQYMLGRTLLVAPIVEKGQRSRAVYLPCGEWTDFFTGEKTNGGRTIVRDCALDEIAVFRKEEDCVG